MAADRRPTTIAGIMILVFVVAALLAFPRYAGEPWFLPALIAAPFALPWIVTPVMLRRNNWQPIDLDYRPFDPFAPNVAAGIAARFRRATSDLQALGFATRGNFRMARPSSHEILGHLGLFERPGSWEVVKLMVHATRRGVNTTLVIQTTLANGTEIVTGDSTNLPPWPSMEGVEGMSFPEVRSARSLDTVHRARIGRRGDRSARELPASDADLPGYLRATVEKNRAWPIAIGFLERDDARGVYRPTWKSAFWNAWGRLWPVGAIRRALRRQRAARTLRELGLDDPRAVGPARA